MGHGSSCTRLDWNDAAVLAVSLHAKRQGSQPAGEGAVRAPDARQGRGSAVGLLRSRQLLAIIALRLHQGPVRAELGACSVNRAQSTHAAAGRWPNACELQRQSVLSLSCHLSRWQGYCGTQGDAHRKAQGCQQPLPALQR